MTRGPSILYSTEEGSSRNTEDLDHSFEYPIDKMLVKRMKQTKQKNERTKQNQPDGKQPVHRDIHQGIPVPLLFLAIPINQVLNLTKELLSSFSYLYMSPSLPPSILSSYPSTFIQCGSTCIAIMASDQASLYFPSIACVTDLVPKGRGERERNNN